MTLNIASVDWFALACDFVITSVGSPPSSTAVTGVGAGAEADFAFEVAFEGTLDGTFDWLILDLDPALEAVGATLEPAADGVGAGEPDADVGGEGEDPPDDEGLVEGAFDGPPANGCCDISRLPDVSGDLKYHQFDVCLVFKVSSGS